MEDNKEIYKDIPGYEGYYQASNFGRIKSLQRLVEHPRGGKRIVKEKILSPGKTNCYYLVCLQKCGKRKMHPVHRLVAAAFIPNIENKPCVNHLNCNGFDNKVENLEWCTQSENVKYAYKMGAPSPKGQLGLIGYASSTGKEIVQKNINNTEIGRFGSATQAAKKLGFNQSKISACARGKKPQYKGYKWEYTNIKTI